jgi:F-type H+-transporting ATPase subunit alpha
VNAGISVSRVGGSAQIPAMKKIAGGLRIQLAQYRELAAFAQFGSDLDKATKQALTRGQRMTELLKQPQYEPMAVEEQVAILYAGSSGALDEVPLPRVGAFEKSYLEHLRANHPALLETIRKDKKWSDELSKQFDAAVTACKQEFLAGEPTGAGDAGKTAAAPKPAATATGKTTGPATGKAPGKAH